MGKLKGRSQDSGGPLERKVVVLLEGGTQVTSVELVMFHFLSGWRLGGRSLSGHLLSFTVCCMYVICYALIKTLLFCNQRGSITYVLQFRV